MPLLGTQIRHPKLVGKFVVLKKTGKSNNISSGNGLSVQSTVMILVMQQTKDYVSQQLWKEEDQQRRMEREVQEEKRRLEKEEQAKTKQEERMEMYQLSQQHQAAT